MQDSFDLVVSLDLLKKLPFKREHYFLVGTVLLVAIIFLLVFFLNPNANNLTPKNQAKLELYVMSQCPYGTQVVDAVQPVKAQFGSNLDLQIDFIAYPKEYYAGKEAQYCLGNLCSMHGVNEVKGDIIELCAMKYSPDNYLDMFVCMNKNRTNIPSNWESCAQSAGVDVGKVQACYQGDEGTQLLEESSARATAINATGSPTIYLNGEQYLGGRTSDSFTTAVCEAYNYSISACSSVAKPQTVSMVVLNDERCAECASVTSLYGQLQSLFPGLQIKELDYSSDEGKALYNSLGLDYLPAVLFDSAVVNSSSYSQIQSYLMRTGDYFLLRIGADFDPTAEICNNGIDDTDNGLIDCDDSDCVGSSDCRPETKNNVQVFVMSDCPYGKEAIKALKGVIDNFGSALDYDVHYIASVNGEGFDSLHGQYEADEDIVQLCVKKYNPDNWFDYVYCRSVEGISGNNWTRCAEDNNIDIDAVTVCANGAEGKALMSADIKIAQSLGIGASPTWLANNKHTFSGIDAETVKTNICKYNPDLEGCDNTLNSTTTASGSCS